VTKRQKRNLARILIAAVLFVVGGVLDHVSSVTWLPILFLLAAYFIVGYDVLLTAVRNIGSGQIFDENFLMSLATIGAFVLQEWSEGVAVMLFYQVGELFQSCAVERSRRSISALMDLRPDFATVLENGEEVQKDPEEVAVGDILLVKPGERIPVDGLVLEGSASLDTSKITGESMPVETTAGEQVLSGCVNLSGVLKIRAESAYAHSTVARILELTEAAQLKKAKTEQFITRFARVYTPAVVAAAVLLAILPPLLLHQPFSTWVERALLFLVISCPCALVISVPLSFFGGMGAASKVGVIIKGSVALEQLAVANTVVFDKTGTLTTGEFHIETIQPSGVSEQELVRLCALAETYSAHPVARAIITEAGDLTGEVSETEEIPGCGICAVVDGTRVLAGNSRLMERENIAYQPLTGAGTVVYVAQDGTFCGAILVCDTVKEEAKRAIPALRARGVQKTVMLTGDGEAPAADVAKKVGLDGYYAALLPQNKVEKLDELMRQPHEGSVLYVGDGINDAPVLTMADVGVAMGGVGSDAAIEAADVVVLTDNPEKIAVSVDIGRKTVRISRQNIVFALVVKLAIMILGALGYANMWMAVFADVGVSVIAILNAMRTMRVKDI
jgi:Cd2+/Zn2+-exporting ATPase